jgi:hypothetical protein|tara:strand:- start:946 stop:1230 length:285 start_codon:yes stop_codon:yes gene_type:complete
MEKSNLFKFKTTINIIVSFKMSFETITTKLLDSVKKELRKEEHIDTINNDIIKPIVDKVLEQLYPYFIGVSMITAFIVISVFVILCLNLKICYF